MHFLACSQLESSLICFFLNQFFDLLVLFFMDVTQLILEGMGRALHTNLNARFKCDALKVRADSGVCYLCFTLIVKLSIARKGFKTVFQPRNMFELPLFVYYFMLSKLNCMCSLLW
jgi:hypothetical protein